MSVATTSLAKATAHDARDRAPRAARDRARPEQRREREPRGRRQDDADESRREPAHDELALGADIKEPGAKRERDAERREE